MQHNVPKEWLENRELGLCPVCAKSKEEFNKGRKIYCSSECSKKYAECFISWQEYKNRLLDNPVCAMCGLTQTSFEKSQKERLKKHNKELAEKYKDQIEAKKLELLREAEKEFLKKIEEIKNMSINDWEISSMLRNEFDEKLKEDYTWRSFFDVDHIVAITNGGDMWDKQNLQVLCIDCHKKKTKEDMKAKGNSSI